MEIQPFLAKLFVILFLLLDNSQVFSYQLQPARRNNSRQTRNRPASHVSPQTSPAQERREKTFRIVWETVKYKHYDPTFGGVNWDAIRDIYAPQVKRVTSDQQLHALLQRMVGELHQSHFAIIPPESIPKFIRHRGRVHLTGAEPDEDAGPADDDLEGDDSEGNIDMSTRLLNGVGIDTRVIDKQIIVTRVDPQSNAAKAGLKTGFAIKSINGIPMSEGVDIASDNPARQPFIDFQVRQTIRVYFLGGPIGTDVQLVYLDGENIEHQALIKRERLTGDLSPKIGELPPMYSEFEAKRLSSGVGYLRFTTFTPQLMENICSSLKSMKDASGVVIDLRANPGGIVGMASGLSGLLTTVAGSVGTLQSRTGKIQLPLIPQKHPYTGPVVVLIDGLSGSTSEVFAAAMQESGRATIIGDRSGGIVQGADTLKLPTGAVFEFARSGFKTAKGVTLEGNGVKPDIEKHLTRPGLLQGKDDQLDEAVRRIETEHARMDAAGKNLPQIMSAVATKPPVIDVNPQTKDPKTIAAPQKFESTPEAEQVMERYLNAIGGKEALAAIKTRVSTGTAVFGTETMTGKVVIREEPPNRRNMELTVPGLGVMQIAFDENRGWMEHPVMGFYEYEPSWVSPLRRFYDISRIPQYKSRYIKMEYRGTVDSTDGQVNVLTLTTSEGQKDIMLFDVSTGLLVYDNEAHYSDYRQVGAVKIPFVTKISESGFEIVTKLDKVEDNVTLNADAFKEIHSCFTER
ncbi:MAG: carboxyl-terminal processing protease [Blastocatellia bacterium]|nr:carboxyl-terminal processing protease [Blastocatellia bacterium]